MAGANTSDLVGATGAFVKIRLVLTGKNWEEKD